MSYSTFEICEYFNIEYERLRVWIDKGFIRPSIQKSIGHGYRNKFSKEDIEKIELFIELLDFGFSRKRAAKIIEDKDPKSDIIKETKNFILIKRQNK